MKRACMIHDAVNLVLLPFITALTVAGLGGWIPPEIVTSVFLGYVGIDLLWVAIQPDAVPSLPGFILLHHATTIVLLLIPFRRPHLHWYVSLEGLVEFNTFCLIARRQWRPLRTLFSWLYWGSFLPLRMVLYPALVPFFLRNMRDVEKAPWWETTAVVGSQTVLCCFNVVLLVLSILNWRKRSVGGGAGGAKSAVAAPICSGSRGARLGAAHASGALLESKPARSDVASVQLKAHAM